MTVTWTVYVQSNDNHWCYNCNPGIIGIIQRSVFIKLTHVVDVLDHLHSLITESWQTSCKLLDLLVLYNDILKRLGQKFRRMWFSVRQSVLRLLNRHLTSLINCHSEVTNWQYYTTRVIPLWLVREVMVGSGIFIYWGKIFV